MKNPILEGARKDYGVHWIGLGALKDLNRSLVLLIEQCGRGLFWGVGFSVNLRVRDSRVEGGLDAYDASEKSKPKPIYSFEVLRVRVMASKPYVRIATKVDRNMRSLVLTGRREFQTSRSFLYADSASPAL